MRLLKSNNDGELTLTPDLTRDIPAYAILSHTWGPDGQEVTFQDVTQNIGQSKTGYEKILFCGRQAKRDGLEYFWVDTCCIDKTSSSELTEAINSMFRWYRNAARCYVYLTDVSTRSTEPPSSWQHQFEQSRWYTRGWTLQELLAPVSVRFFSVEGDYLGDRESLQSTIHRITKIPVAALRGAGLSQFPSHERLAWAMSRQTTREEDAAYCLLGIFDIFLPLIYGEGRTHAIARLLERINQQTGAPAISSQPSLPAHQDPQRLSPQRGNDNVLGCAIGDKYRVSTTHPQASAAGTSPTRQKETTIWTFGIEIQILVEPHKIRDPLMPALYYEKVAAALRKRNLQAKADNMQNPHRRYPEHYDKWWMTKCGSLESSSQSIAMEAVSPVLEVSGPWETEVNTYWQAMRAVLRTPIQSAHCGTHVHIAPGNGTHFYLSTLKRMAYGIVIYEPLILRLLMLDQVNMPHWRPNSQASEKLWQCRRNWASIALLIRSAVNTRELAQIMQDSRFVLWNFENIKPGKSGTIEFRGGWCLRGEASTRRLITFAVCLLHAIVAMDDISRLSYYNLSSWTAEALYTRIREDATVLSLDRYLPDDYEAFRDIQSACDISNQDRWAT